MTKKYTSKRETYDEEIAVYNKKDNLFFVIDSKESIRMFISDLIGRISYDEINGNLLLFD